MMSTNIRILNLQSDVMIHAENNSPFLAVTSMERLLEVSHWGNIAVEETLDIRHTGALLKGSFSRYDYQRNQDGVASIKSFKVRKIASVTKTVSHSSSPLR